MHKLVLFVIAIKEKTRNKKQLSEFYFEKEFYFYATSISGCGASESTLLWESAVNFKAKMSQNLVFYSETKSILETVIKTTVDVIGNSKEENATKEPNVRRKVSQRVIL